MSEEGKKKEVASTPLSFDAIRQLAVQTSNSRRGKQMDAEQSDRIKFLVRSKKLSLKDIIALKDAVTGLIPEGIMELLNEMEAKLRPKTRWLSQGMVSSPAEESVVKFSDTQRRAIIQALSKTRSSFGSILNSSKKKREIRTRQGR